jgi:kynureninase
MNARFSEELKQAESLDAQDPLARFRDEFLFPKAGSTAVGGMAGQDVLYFAGNSLGLQPRKARQYIEEELEDWQRFGVEGHMRARHPWLPYHEFVTESLARIVGAKSSEVVAMNTLTVNLHLMMVSFYRPTKTRYKILIEPSAFPSDQYAVASQADFHSRSVGFDPKSAIVELQPRSGEDCLRDEDILAAIEREGESLALVMLGNVNYLTGQAFDVKAITEKARSLGACIGFDFAHGAGNLELKLHDWAPDFAVWCSYKYLNSGPGALAGCFVHERHHRDSTLPRFAGWWGQNKTTRFLMGPEFDPIPTAESWQLSNPPIFQLAAMRASFEIFDAAGMARLRAKSVAIVALLESLLKKQSRVKIVTPAEGSRRGTQLSIRVQGHPKDWVQKLERRGIVADAREPDILRVAPAPLYTRYADVVKLAESMDAISGGQS